MQIQKMTHEQLSNRVQYCLESRHDVEQHTFGGVTFTTTAQEILVDVASDENFRIEL